MRKILFAISMLLAIVACTNDSTGSVKPREEAVEIPFEVAKNYFFRNDQQIPNSPKITTEEDFNKFFGMATVMGEDGKPTTIDFTKQFVLAVVYPETDTDLEINPINVKTRGNSLIYTYEAKAGEKQSFTIQPFSIIILDKQYENYEVKLVCWIS